MSFLPENYKVPVQSNYMRFEEGENRFRILSEQPIFGYEYWVEEDKARKPIRVREFNELPKEALIAEDKPKHFWAMVVYNFTQNKIQILEITQKGIMTSLQALFHSKAWGHPNQYTISVTRSGQGFDTEYTVMPEPKEKLKEDVQGWESINLEALYDGLDPFADASESVSTGDLDKIFEEIEGKK